MDFLKLVEKINNLDVTNKNEINDILIGININEQNFNDWVNNIFSDKVNLFNMGKLPYIIDELYKSNDKYYFMLCCMLIESTCDKLEFITNLENYSLFKAKFETLVNTLVTVYEYVDNGIANCMALIILNNDPKFTFFNDELKERLTKATARKLNDIINYIKDKKKDVNPVVFNDLEVIVDLACYLKNQEINKLINEIDDLINNNNVDIFIIKYKIINDLKTKKEKIECISKDEEKLITLYSVMERLGVNNIYLNDISQEMIAKSDMIRWLSYPTELGSKPDKIELLGSFDFNNTKCFAFGFSKDNFKIKGTLIGVSGGYPIDHISSVTCGYTFSKFEELSEDWKHQAFELANFISDYWKNRT
jgi:hypothetical protein